MKTNQPFSLATTFLLLSIVVKRKMDTGLSSGKDAGGMRLAAESGVGYPGWRVVSAGYMGVMLGYSVVIPFTFGIFLKPLAQAFGWHRDSISVALSCVAITVALCAPLMGRLLDAFGPRRTILPCIALFSLAFASLAFLTPHLWHMYAIFVLLGTVGNGTTQLAYARAVTTWFSARRGMALSLISCGAGMGAMILPVLAAYLLRHIGWRLAYAVLGALILTVSFPLAALFLREFPSGTGSLGIYNATLTAPRVQQFSLRYMF